MTGNPYDPDMGRGVTALRCVADFVGSRPGLAPFTAVDVVWSHVDLTWCVKVMVQDATAAEMDAWAHAIDDAVTTSTEGSSRYVGAYSRIDVVGTVHGLPVTVWTTRDGDSR